MMQLTAFADDLEQEADRIAKAIYGGTFTGYIDETLTKLVAQKLMLAVYEGFGNTLTDLQSDTPDYNMLANLERNVYQFSAAKNFQMLKDINGLLRDDKGDLRTLSDFRTAVKQLNIEYNATWLQTEYITAIGSAESAANWVSYQKNGVQLLKYVTAHDERVRASHKAIDGVKRNLDDEFWNVHYPPNGFRCRCTTVQLNAGTQTPTDKIPQIDVPELFRTNLAKSGLCYPHGHPYYKGVPQSVLTNANNLIPKSNE